MSRLDMEFKRGGLQELLLTMAALVGARGLMRLHMIMHSVLAALCDTACGTDEFPLCILLVLVCHT
jgi:hypothetical protein